MFKQFGQVVEPRLESNFTPSSLFEEGNGTEKINKLRDKNEKIK